MNADLKKLGKFETRNQKFETNARGARLILSNF